MNDQDRWKWGSRYKILGPDSLAGAQGCCQGCTHDCAMPSPMAHCPWSLSAVCQPPVPSSYSVCVFVSLYPYLAMLWAQSLEKEQGGPGGTRRATTWRETERKEGVDQSHKYDCSFCSSQQQLQVGRKDTRSLHTQTHTHRRLLTFFQRVQVSTFPNCAGTHQQPLLLPHPVSSSMSLLPVIERER